MATTTNYGWTTPDDTALVKDGAAAIRTLGSSVDTTTKNLNPETTLGDIAYRSSTANTNTRLGIGTSGQVLTVSGGVPAWTTLASGATYVGCAAFRNTNLSISSNTDTLLTLPSEQYDTDGFHDTSTNTGRFTIPAGKAGKYQMNCAVGFTNQFTSVARIMLYVNGVRVTTNGFNLGRIQDVVGSGDFISGSQSYSFAVADYAEIYIIYNGGPASMNIESARITFDYLGA
jgi:hypothetical protein